MAKTINCPFCGKEITKGFFDGDAASLDVGAPINLSCCEDCAKEYKAIAKQEKKRFEIKINNYKRSSRLKVTDELLGKLYKKYLDEMYAQEEKALTEGHFIPGSFFYYDSNGYFWVREAATGLGNEDVSTWDMYKTLNTSKTNSYGFTKDDISMIEYRLVSNCGKYLDGFKCAFSYEVRFNDEKTITYKPCITKHITIAESFIPFVARKKAKKLIVEHLEYFKKTIGSDLPIVEVKTFR